MKPRAATSTARFIHPPCDLSSTAPYRSNASERHADWMIQPEQQHHGLGGQNHTTSETRTLLSAWVRSLSSSTSIVLFVGSTCIDRWTAASLAYGRSAAIVATPGREQPRGVAVWSRCCVLCVSLLRCAWRQLAASCCSCCCQETKKSKTCFCRPDPISYHITYCTWYVQNIYQVWLFVLMPFYSAYFYWALVQLVS